jgi:quinol monooxygenase YgiN
MLSYRKLYSSISRNFSSFQKTNQVLHLLGTLVPGKTYEFHRSTLKNAKKSILENGIARYDIMRELNNPDKFLLSEVFTEFGAFERHRNSVHCTTWGEEIGNHLKSDIDIIEYATLFPEKTLWDTDKSASSIDVNQYVSSLDWPDSTDYNVSDFDSLTPHDDKHRSLLAVVVQISVKNEFIDDFITLTLENCKHSIREPGIHRFDFLKQVNSSAELINPQLNTNNTSTKFVLVEIYNDANAPALHKETTHYITWKNGVECMMAQPRQSTKYLTMYPQPLYYHTKNMINSYQNIIKNAGNSIHGLKPELHFTSPFHEYGLGGVSNNNSFSFTSPNIKMGRNIASSAIIDSLKSFHINKPLIVTGSSGLVRYPELRKCLEDNQYYNEDVNTQDCNVINIKREPTVTDIQNATSLALRLGCDGVLAIGGGSVIDAGKVLSAMIKNSGVCSSVCDYIVSKYLLTNYCMR